MKATAAVLYQSGEALIVKSGIDVPELKPGQVLVKLAYSGVCHSQVMEVRGHRGHDAYLPHMLGHEGSGVVVSVGAGVAKVKPGDKVILGWIKGVGADVPSTEYALDGARINAGAVTTFSDYAVISENRCIPLPEGVPMEIAPLFGCAVLTGIGIVDYELNPPPGSTIAVFGLGGIGASALMACTLREPSALIAVDVAPDKLQLAREIGATHVIDASKTDPVAALREMTGGRGVDFAVEAAGRVRTIEQAFESIRRGGLCVFASHPAAGEKISIDPYELIAGKNIRGSWGGGCKPDIDVPRLAEAYRAGRLPLELMVNRVYALDQVNEAIDDLEQRRAMRPLIAIDPSLG
jgi:S-(hydroxymethyl)glutathione dehydrogenase/alcohol dehydrogenase